MTRERAILSGGPQAPRTARAEVRSRLAGRVDGQTLSDVELLVSELATNSVRHGSAGEDAPLELELELADDRLLVRWSDPGPGFADRRIQPHVDRTGGYGLVLLERLATRWGVERAERFCVWFEVEPAEVRTGTSHGAVQPA